MEELFKKKNMGEGHKAKKSPTFFPPPSVPPSLCSLGVGVGAGTDAGAGFTIQPCEQLPRKKRQIVCGPYVWMQLYNFSRIIQTPPYPEEPHTYRPPPLRRQAVVSIWDLNKIEWGALINKKEVGFLARSRCYVATHFIPEFRVILRF